MCKELSKFDGQFTWKRLYEAKRLFLKTKETDLTKRLYESYPRVVNHVNDKIYEVFYVDPMQMILGMSLMN